MWRQCLPEAVLKVTNLGPTRAKLPPPTGLCCSVIFVKNPPYSAGKHKDIA